MESLETLRYQMQTILETYTNGIAPVAQNLYRTARITPREFPMQFCSRLSTSFRTVLYSAVHCRQVRKLYDTAQHMHKISKHNRQIRPLLEWGCAMMEIVHLIKPSYYKTLMICVFFYDPSVL